MSAQTQAYNPGVTTRADLEATRAALAGCAEPGLVAAWLFGSRARGTARPGSDVDVALLYASPPDATLSALPERVAAAVEAAMRTEADLVVLNHAAVDLVHRVLRDGVLLLDRRPSARIAFEVRSRREYFDLLPSLGQYRRPPGREARP